MVLVILILQVWGNHEANEAFLAKAIPDNSSNSSSRVTINNFTIFIVYLI